MINTPSMDDLDLEQVVRDALAVVRAWESGEDEPAGFTFWTNFYRALDHLRTTLDTSDS